MAKQKINSSQAGFTKLVDSNGWTVYDYGAWKEYHQSQTMNPPSLATGAGASFPTLSLPIGVASINNVFVSVSGAANFSEMTVLQQSPGALTARIVNRHTATLDATTAQADWFLKDK